MSLTHAYRITQNPENAVPHYNALARRSLLKSLGFAAGWNMVGGGVHKAKAASRAPTRIVFFYTENGTLQSAWKPEASAGKTVATETDFQLGELLRPALSQHQKDLLIIENLDMISCDLDVTPFGGSHQRMQVHGLTGAPRLRPEVAGTPSVDQIIGKAINSPAAVTAFPSLTFASGRSYGDQLMNWSAAGQYLVPEGNIMTAYNRLVGAIKPGASATAAAIAAQKRKMVYDTLNADFGDLKPRLSKNDLLKVDAHASGLADLEMRLGLGSNATCVAPDKANAQAASTPADTRAFWDKNADAFLRLVTTSLACDLTRVVNLQFGGLMPEEITGYQGDIHLGVVHGVSGDTSLAQLKRMSGYANMVKYHQWYAQQFANLIAMLKSIPEGEPGETLLDHTVIFWHQNMAAGGHDPHAMPYVLAGNANGFFRTGRYIKYNRRAATAEESAINNLDGDKAKAPPTRGLPHNNLLVSLANSMGVPITTIGNPKCCTGPLPELR